MFRRILIANRGEIAVRIIRACREMGIASVAVFSQADRQSLHVRLADQAYPVGPPAARQSYLCVDKILDVARRSACDALHPGYGFLAENPELARACSEAGIAFIGPPAEAMEQLGSKTAARQLAHRAGIPMVPGVREPLASFEAARQIAEQLGYPLLLKAVAGGGGKGMRLVSDPAGLASAWRDAASEALNAFGDGRLYMEKYLHRPRHIEIQIFGDRHGNFVHFGERECSVQRRHQKVIEESPSPFVTPQLRAEMGEAAVRLARAAGYSNAGTVEFLVDAARNFYFLEVNTRLQVEHPVTESVAGADLVKLQIRAAFGEPLPFSQNDIAFRGHAIECRIYAEDPRSHFFPSPGVITFWNVPHGPGIRFDEGVCEGCAVPGDYDPLLGKLIASGADRAEALARLRRALDEFGASGVQTNLAFLRAILDHEEFLRNEIDTRWLDERLDSLLGTEPQAPEFAADAAALAAILSARGTAQTSPPPAALPPSRWKMDGRLEQLSRLATGTAETHFPRNSSGGSGP